MKQKNFLQKLLGKKSEDEEDYSSLNLEEKDMIKGIVELSQTTVKEVMIPRIDVVFVSKDDPLDELLETVSTCGHSRVPVYAETIDNVVGILYVKDLLRVLVKQETVEIDAVMRTPYFIPDSKRLDSLLREMKRRRVHIAVAVDEYGGVSGIICLEDIIEEIVGDIQDEFDDEQEDYLKVGENTYLCDARASLEDLNEELGLNIPESDFDTLGGFVFDLFGKIPVKYEKAAFENIDFVIQEMNGHKINTVKLIINEKPSL